MCEKLVVCIWILLCTKGGPGFCVGCVMSCEWNRRNSLLLRHYSNLQRKSRGNEGKIERGRGSRERWRETVRTKREGGVESVRWRNTEFRDLSRSASLSPSSGRGLTQWPKPPALWNNGLGKGSVEEAQLKSLLLFLRGPPLRVTARLKRNTPEVTHTLLHLRFLVTQPVLPHGASSKTLAPSDHPQEVEVMGQTGQLPHKTRYIPPQRKTTHKQSGPPEAWEVN